MKYEHQEWVYHSSSVQDTERLAARLAKLAVPGSVIALDGDLGAGKTAFSKYFAQYLGVEGVVNSPTFTLIKEYEGRLALYHMDVYRITLDEAEGLGLDEYFYGSGVSLIEWSSIISELLPEAHLHIQMTVTETGDRIIRLNGYGSPYTDWCEDLKRSGVD
ncbi:tRNA (adenosine(37)-N6)-threonylcarbamoyltransferase complex ATPase subunit type 1 TsaE [Paenibacillus shunpengii]|uniref:tRNA threonylcarbamoyladenosine biosynthesis protein TsaE n=1 Tax=Paenibacillus shunpengii TaxID=2054424 RepID=A0ABW5SJN2_9BACL|nr:tRNA (adenosine(37)-N6)-threonylcarbamoyltransferase complex ATPase subunit type 1 TsaE [Paenibacillus sp. PDC88]SDX30883.1 tRNA threonylcarbamoyladenosine biosynthesis protein TsaE [Paenibacillus sp. PDC88]